MGKRGNQRERRRSVSCSSSVAGQHRQAPGRRFWWLLGGICLADFAVRVLILSDAWGRNPLATIPINDAATNWEWAGQIAGGRWLGSTPFLSAPLYPYLLGLLRAFGAGLGVVYGFQVVLHLATVVLVGLIGARRFGGGVGLLAAGLFAALAEPAFFAGRVLNCTLQAFLVCLLWLQLLVGQSRSTGTGWILAGVLVGLNCLANPPMMLIVPAVGFWVSWQRRREGDAARSAALAVAAAVAVIVPATMHNYVASGAFIPISAQAGLTFYHGNNPGANGTYSPVPGISIDRRHQNVDAFAVYQQATGKAGDWGEVDRFFFKKGLAYWVSASSRAMKLMGLKLYWFASSSNYGDIYLPSLEAKSGLLRWLILAPVPVAWLIPTALVAVFVLVRRPCLYGPEVMLLGVPLLVVVLFWYSPRYRFPAVPVISIAAAWAICQALRWRTRPGWSVAVACSLVVLAGVGVVNRRLHLDSPRFYRDVFVFSVGDALSGTGRVGEAVAWYRSALASHPESAQIESLLGDALRRQGRLDEALTHLERAVQASPVNAASHNHLGIALMGVGRVVEGIEHFRSAVRLRPADPVFHNNLANALFTEKGKSDEAKTHYQAALHARPAFPDAHFNLGLLHEQAGREDLAFHHYSEALRFDPKMAEPQYGVALILLRRGQACEGLDALWKAHTYAPGDIRFTTRLAWELATQPGECHDSVTALTLAGEANARARGQDAKVLDALAAALAAQGRYDEAISTVQRGIEVAYQQGLSDQASAMRARLERYRQGEPYTSQ